MASDHEERKHRRTSDDESEEPSKRRKHRHHRRRHHRHHSRKHEKHEDRREEDDEETTDMPPPPPPANCRTDYDMEEGEIVEEDGADLGRKTADSDAESGEIKTEIHGDMAEPDHSLSLPLDDDNSHLVGGHLKDGDHENNGSKTKGHTENGYMGMESQKGSGNRKSHYDDDNDDGYETRDRKKPLSNENYVKAHKDSSSKHVHERSREDIPTTSRSRSHDHNRARSRSRSQSISRGASRLEKHKEDIESYRSKETSGIGDNERTNSLVKDYRHGSRDLVRDKERERSSSRSRHSLQLDKRDRDGDRDRYRERDLKEIERERMRKERGT